MALLPYNRGMKLRLREVLLSLGISQRELAKRLGVDHQLVNYYVTSQRCTMARLRLLAEKLQVSERELVEFER